MSFICLYIFTTFWRHFCISLLDATTFVIFKIYKLTFKFYLYIHLCTFIIYIWGICIVANKIQYNIYLFIYLSSDHILFVDFVSFSFLFCYHRSLSLVIVVIEVSSIRNRHSHSNYLNFAYFFSLHNGITLIWNKK